MNNPSSTNKRKKIGIFRFFILFSKMWKIRVIKRVGKIGNSTDPWLTSTPVEKKNEVKPFHKKQVFLFTK